LEIACVVQFARDATGCWELIAPPPGKTSYKSVGGIVDQPSEMIFSAYFIDRISWHGNGMVNGGVQARRRDKIRLMP
jgi:hypothetical protein